MRLHTLTIALGVWLGVVFGAVMLQQAEAFTLHVDVYGVQGDDSRGHGEDDDDAQAKRFNNANPVCSGSASCAYSPEALTLSVGDSIEFLNVGKMKHSAAGNFEFSPRLSQIIQPTTSSNNFSTGKLKTGEVQRIGPFHLPGSMGYYCMIHGPGQMRGALRVSASETTTTTTTSTTTTTTTTSAAGTTSTTTTTSLPTTTTTTTGACTLHDLVVKLPASPYLPIGQIVDVSVSVSNMGNCTETAQVTLEGDINYSSSQTTAVSLGTTQTVIFRYPVPVRLQVTLTATGALAPGLSDQTPNNNTETKTFSTRLAGADSKTIPVTVANDSPWFHPTRLSIVIGDTVKWTNLSQGTHTITSLQMANPQLTAMDSVARDSGLDLGGAFDRRAFGPGQTFSVTFDEPGTFPYVCFIHPYMAGNITVTMPGAVLAAGPVPDIIQGPNTPTQGLPTNNGFPAGIGEVCITGDMEKPSAALPSGVVHCIDALSMSDLSLAAFDANPAASIRTLGAADVGAGSTHLVGRQIGGRFEGMDNAHNVWYTRDGTRMFVTEWHGSRFWTIDRMTNTFGSPANPALGLGAAPAGTDVFLGADVTHVMTTVPAENVGVLTLEGGVDGSLGLFDPSDSRFIGRFIFGPRDHPHGPWITCPGEGNGGGVIVSPMPMSNQIAAVNLPGTPSQQATLRWNLSSSPNTYPVATGAQSSLPCNRAKVYTSSAVSGTIGVRNAGTGLPIGIGVITLPACAQCTLMGAPASGTTVPIQIPFTPDNRFATVALGKAAQVAIIDANSDSVINVVDCGSGCHGANMGAKRGGGFYSWVSMQYQDKVSVVDMDSLVKAGDVPVNVRSILSLQGLTPIGCPTCVAVVEGKWGGMGVGPFPLPPPWHLSINVSK